MVPHLAAQQNEARVENKSQVDDDVRQNRSSLLQKALRLGIPGSCKIEDLGCAACLGARRRTLVCPPAFQDSRGAQQLLDLSVLMDGGMLPRDVGHPQI